MSASLIQGGRTSGAGVRMSWKRVPSRGRVRHERAGVRHAFGAGRIEHGAQEASGVRLELCLGRPDRLEVQHVEERVGEEHLEDLDRRGGRVRIRDAHVVERRDALGMEPPHLPHHHGPPVVAHEGGAVVAVVIEEAGEVAGELVRPVVGDRGRVRAPAVAAQVGGVGAVARVGQRVELMAPRVPELGEAMAEDDGRPVGRPGHRHVQLDPVRRHLFVRHLSHGASPAPPSGPPCRLFPHDASEWPT